MSCARNPIGTNGSSFCKCQVPESKWKNICLSGLFIFPSISSHVGYSVSWLKSWTFLYIYPTSLYSSSKSSIPLWYLLSISNYLLVNCQIYMLYTIQHLYFLLVIYYLLWMGFYNSSLGVFSELTIKELDKTQPYLKHSSTVT